MLRHSYLIRTAVTSGRTPSNGHERRQQPCHYPYPGCMAHRHCRAAGDFRILEKEVSIHDERRPDGTSATLLT